MPLKERLTNDDRDELSEGVDDLDAAYIQMFATEYQAVCDGLEASGQQLDIIQTTISLWENCGILQ